MDAILMGGHDTASREYLTFALAAEEYALDILHVREIRPREPMTHIAGAPAHVEGVINLRGTVVPIVNLRAKFALEPWHGTPAVIILAIAGRLVGMTVDAVIDVARLADADIRPVSQLGAVALEQPFLRGIAPMGSRMLVVVDVETLVAAGQSEDAPAEMN